MKTLSIILIFVSTIILIYSTIIMFKYKKLIKEYEISVKTDIEFNDLELKDSIKQFIKQMNLNHPDIVYAQALLESGNFKSSIFKNNHNIFGMKEPLIRNTVALGTKNNHAYYKNWQHSIIDYALYQSTYLLNGHNYRSLNRQAYLEFLSKNYAEDPLYIKKLNTILNNEKN